MGSRPVSCRESTLHPAPCTSRCPTPCTSWCPAPCTSRCPFPAPCTSWCQHLSAMDLARGSLILVLTVGSAVSEGDHTLPHSSSVEHPNDLAAPVASRTTGYGAENLYYDYSNGIYTEAAYPTAAERQGVDIEALIAAPIIVTAFSAALFGGLLSPAITYGLNRIGEFEFTKKKKKRKKSMSKGKYRSQYEEPEFSWLDTLETVGELVQQLRTKRSTDGKFDKFLSPLES